MGPLKHWTRRLPSRFRYIAMAPMCTRSHSVRFGPARLRFHIMGMSHGMSRNVNECIGLVCAYVLNWRGVGHTYFVAWKGVGSDLGPSQGRFGGELNDKLRGAALVSVYVSGSGGRHNRLAPSFPARCCNAASRPIKLSILGVSCARRRRAWNTKCVLWHLLLWRPICGDVAPCMSRRRRIN